MIEPIQQVHSVLSNLLPLSNSRRKVTVKDALQAVVEVSIIASITVLTALSKVDATAAVAVLGGFATVKVGSNLLPTK